MLSHSDLSATYLMHTAMGSSSSLLYIDQHVRARLQTMRQVWKYKPVQQMPDMVILKVILATRTWLQAPTMRMQAISHL